MGWIGKKAVKELMAVLASHTEKLDVMERQQKGRNDLLREQNELLRKGNDDMDQAMVYLREHMDDGESWKRG